MVKHDWYKLILLVFSILVVFVGVVFLSFFITDYVRDLKHPPLPLCSEVNQGESCKIEIEIN